MQKELPKVGSVNLGAVKNSQFRLDSRFKTVEEQASAFVALESQAKIMSQHFLELKNQLDNSKNQGLNSPVPAVNADPNGKIDAIKSEKLDAVDVIAMNDMKKLSDLASQGKITPEEAAQLKIKLDARVQAAKQDITAKFQYYGGQIIGQMNDATLNSFQQQNNGFFDIPARLEVLDYLKEMSNVLSPEQLNRVAELIYKIETAAITRVQADMQKQDQFKSINNEAKLRLNSAVNSSSTDIQAGKKSFSRNDIKMMSNDEFNRYEKMIFEQMQKGQL